MVGLAVTLAGRDAGWRVTTVARYPHQARAARALGAGRVLETMEAAPRSGFELVAECVGSTETLEGAVAACRPRGAVVALTDFGGTLQFDLSPFFLKGLHLVGTLCYCDHGGDPDFPRAAALLVRHPEVADVLVTHRFPLERVADAYAAADDKASCAIKVVVEP
jgi:threonine dehydrogenase-like Zn-dependent dehydrogenase